MHVTGANTVADVAAVKAAERAAIAAGVSEDMLIEHAVAGLLNAVQNMPCRSIAVVYGSGNNGADGLTLARHLAAQGRDVTLVAGTDSIRNDRYVKAALYCGARMGDLSDFTADDLIVDALFGTGLNRPPEGTAAESIAAINRSRARVLAVDVPSGLNAQTGAGKTAVCADKTVTFGCLKPGLLLGDAPDLVGEIVVAPIGLKSVETIGRLTTATDLPPARKKNSHKGMFGRVYIIGGSARMPGAPVLTACAAVAAGAGYVTLCAPDCSVVYDLNAAMCTRLPLPTADGCIAFDEPLFVEICEKADCIVIGNGMGTAPDLGKMLRYIAAHFHGVLIVDADGLNALAKDRAALAGHTCKLLLTPHPGELRRLDESDGDPIERAKRLAAELNCVVAAKNTVTVISDGKDCLFNVEGTPALAKGGSGDVLAGIAAAYACRLPLLRATAAACYKLGRTASRRYADKDENALLSFEVIDAIDD